MKPSALKSVLALSLLLNAGVIGAVAYRASATGDVPASARLKLSPAQLERWNALEARFVGDFEAAGTAIAAHREKLIREIFSETPSQARIELEREAIAKLQSEQQRRVIAQLLAEREMLEPTQRQALAEMLLHQATPATAEQRLHRK